MTKPLVLVVEDEAPLVTLLRYNLEKEGFQVCEAGDGEEGSSKSTNANPISSFSIGCCRWFLASRCVAASGAPRKLGRSRWSF